MFNSKYLFTRVNKFWGGIYLSTGGGIYLSTGGGIYLSAMDNVLFATHTNE